MTDRRGFTLLEIFAAFIVLGAAGTLVVQMLVALAHHREAVDRRAIAQQAAANLLERAVALGPTELTPAAASQLALSSEVAAGLPGARLEVSVEEAAGPPAARRVTVRLAWTGRGGRPVAPVSLAAWVYGSPPGGGT